MSNQNFITFKSYHDKSILEDEANILRKEDIEVVIEDCSLAFDPTMSNNETSKDFRLKLLQQDFQKASDVLERNAGIDIDKLPNDYYLLKFSDEELRDVVKKRDEWGTFDVALAKQLLRIKGMEITVTEESDFKKERISELSKPDVSSNFWIIIGYVIASFGGFIGIIWGLFLLQYKKTLPNGQRVNGYPESQRWHGVFITIIGVISLTFWITMRIIYKKFW